MQLENTNNSQNLNQDAYFTRAELVAQLPPMNMTQSIQLIARDPDGSEHPAQVGYSSDLKAFALMTYGQYGESGQLGITSWYPLPTKITRHRHGYGKSEIRYAEQVELVTDRTRKTGQTLYRFAAK